MTVPITQYINGERLIGDDYTATQIQEWFDGEKHDCATIITEDIDATFDPYVATHKLLGFRHLKGRTFNHALGFGSAFGSEFRPILPQLKKITILDPGDPLAVSDIDGFAVDYRIPDASGTIDFPDNTFDLILCFGVLHHIPNVSYVVGELGRVLAPNGFLLIREPAVNMGDWRTPRHGLTARERGIPEHIMRQAIDAAGLRVATKSYCEFVPIMKLAQLLGIANIYSKMLPTRIDSILSRVFAWNLRYNRRHIFHNLHLAHYIGFARKIFKELFSLKLFMKRFLRHIIKNIPIVDGLRLAIKRGLQRLVGKRHYIQDTKPTRDYPLIELGSQGCGWVLVDDASLHNSVILSAGLGEDASFDVEFAKRYNATVHMVDPTPRAISHFEAIKARIGKTRAMPFATEGVQPPQAYELKDIESNQLQLHKIALWNQAGKVKFFLPKNQQHVSHSIVNFQHGYSDKTDHIEVEAITMKALLKRLNIDAQNLALIKLDIEGAEIEVIENMLADGLRPKQLLVEFDEFNVPTKRGLVRIDQTHRLLLDAGYKLLHTDRIANFLYYRTQ